MTNSFFKRRQESVPGVAPVHLIRDDFRSLESRETLRTTSDIQQLILIQTVEGHSHSGYGPFNGRNYPNTTLDDVSKALMLSPLEVKAARQSLVDDIRIFAERVIYGEKLTTLTNRENEPLMGIGTFRMLEIDPRGVLQGLYLGGLRDTFEIRKQAQEKWGVPIGYGKCYPVRRRVMNEMNLNGADLARKEHGQEIDDFKRRGLIAGDSGGDDISYMFIRHESGYGASDDAAVVMAGRLYGVSAALGCFLADAIDTLEKYTITSDDQDAEISRLIEESDYDLGISRDDAIDLTYLANIPRNNDTYVPDSSLQEMLSIDRMTDQCVLESHLLYARGYPFAPQDMGRGKTTNLEFYQYIERRIEDCRRGKAT